MWAFDESGKTGTVDHLQDSMWFNVPGMLPSKRFFLINVCIILIAYFYTDKTQA